jgi:hypothetical protein
MQLTPNSYITGRASGIGVFDHVVHGLGQGDLNFVNTRIWHSEGAQLLHD